MSANLDICPNSYISEEIEHIDTNGKSEKKRKHVRYVSYSSIF